MPLQVPAARRRTIREILDRDLCANARRIGDHLRARIADSQVFLVSWISRPQRHR